MVNIKSSRTGFKPCICFYRREDSRSALSSS